MKTTKKTGGGGDLSNSLSSLMNNSVLSFKLMADYYVLFFFCLPPSHVRDPGISGGVSCRDPGK